MLRNIVLLALCIAFAEALPHDVKPKLTPVPAGERVIQGWPAVNGQFPHMAYLSVGCGGSLISDRFVITAAHCVDTTSSTTVYMGSVNIGQSPLVIFVTRIHIYPGWNPSNLNNDIALLEFDAPISFTENIRPIAVANSRDQLYVGEIATLSGFGYVNDNFDGPDVLQHVNMRVISNAECAQYFGIFIIDSTICGNGADTPAQGSCFGDSGSGLILRRPEGDLLVGVTSFIGWEGCEGHNPSGYVRPNFFIEWIRGITGLPL